jgi:hypothetical protein
MTVLEAEGNKLSPKSVLPELFAEENILALFSGKLSQAIPPMISWSFWGMDDSLDGRPRISENQD